MPKFRPEGWFNQQMDDGGPVYMETNPGDYILEPWNALSSLLMLVPAIYWIFRMRKEGHQPLVMWIVISLIIVGGVGSALFHAFRASYIFLIMDVLPTALLTISLAVYFWYKVLRRWGYVLVIFLPLFSLRFLLWKNLPEHTAINVSYAITGFSIGLPLIIHLTKTEFKGGYLVAGTIVSFIVALLFREIDRIPFSFLPMGTHFLWHSFAALGAYFMLWYLDSLFMRKTT